MVDGFSQVNPKELKRLFYLIKHNISINVPDNQSWTNWVFIDIY